MIDVDLSVAGLAPPLHLRGATNSKARKDYGWEPVHPSWQEGFRTALG